MSTENLQQEGLKRGSWNTPDYNRTSRLKSGTVEGTTSRKGDASISLALGILRQDELPTDGRSHRETRQHQS